MRWERTMALVGDKRTRERFAWWPTEVEHPDGPRKRRYVWLERYAELSEFAEWSDYNYKRKNGWLWVKRTVLR